MTGNGFYIPPINIADDWGMVQMALFYLSTLVKICENEMTMFDV